jgi:hypothetical protein
MFSTCARRNNVSNNLQENHHVPCSSTKLAELSKPEILTSY